MATGYSRNLYCDMFTSDKYLELSAGQRLLWIFLFSGPLTLKCGIVKKSYSEFSRQCGLSRKEIEETLNLFASNDYEWIEQDEHFIWVIDFIEDQESSANWYASARKSATELIGKTKLAEKCLARYPAKPYGPGSSKRRSNGVSTTSELPLDGVETLVTGSDTGKKYSPPTQDSEQPRARELKGGDGGETPGLLDLEARLPAAAQGPWQEFKARAAKHCADPGGLKGQEIEEKLSTILDGADEHKLTPDQLVSGFAAAKRNGSVAPLYVINAARGIVGSKATVKGGHSEQYERRSA